MKHVLSDQSVRDVTNSVLEELGEVGEIFPHAKTAILAYRYLKKKRIKTFLRSLSLLEEQMSVKEKKKLRAYLGSQEGLDLLGEYIDIVHQTSSSIAHCALALLLVDSEKDQYSGYFKVMACTALKNLSDDLVEAFLQITDPFFLSRREIGTKGPYPVYSLQVSKVEYKTDEMKGIPPMEMLVGWIHVLTNRGLLLPDYASSRLGGDKVTAQAFGTGKQTEDYRALLLRARNLLKELDV